MYKFLFIFILMTGIVRAEHYIYKVEEGDDLSTVIYSSSKGTIKEGVKDAVKINRISENRIEKGQLLILEIDDLNRCNVMIKDNLLTIKEKYQREEDKERIYKECFERMELAKERDGKRKVSFTLLTGRETLNLNNKSSSFRGELSTNTYWGYDLKLDFLETKKYSFNFHHGLRVQDYKELNSMTYKSDSHILPSFGLSFMKNKTFASPFLALHVRKEVFASEINVNTLALDDKYVSLMELGYKFQMDKLSLSTSLRLSSHDRGASLEGEYTLGRYSSFILRGDYQKRDSDEKRGSVVAGIKLRN
jgi:hypothetical protein